MGALVAQGLPPWLSRDVAGKLSGKIEHAEAGLQTMTDTAGRLWAWNPMMPTPEWQVVHVLQGYLNNLWSVSGKYYGTPSSAGSRQIYNVPQNQPILGTDMKSAFAGESILIPGLSQPAPGPTGEVPSGTTPIGVGGLPTGLPTGSVPTTKPDWWPSDWPWPPTTAQTTTPTGGETPPATTPATTTGETPIPGLPSEKPAWWPTGFPWPPTSTSGMPPTGTAITPVSSTTPGAAQPTGLSRNAKIAIGVGAGVVVIGTVTAIVLATRKRRRRRRG